MGTFDKVPSTGGKSYYNKQERDRFAYTNDPSHRCSNPNPNRLVAFDELMAADIVPELMYF
jgi:hypothetical protein